MESIHTVVTNYSRYSKEAVWENAQDLEHVSLLHPHTNAGFELVFAESFLKKSEYDVLVYRAKRKVFCFRIASFGMRKIIAPFNLHQVEFIPLLGVTSALNSLLMDSDKAEYKTKMVDEVVMQIPWWLSPLKGFLTRSLHRHAAVQCSEDEPFRERMESLWNRGVRMPYRLFNSSTFQNLTHLFKEKLH